MMACFGVHVGSTSCCLAISKAEKVEVVANDCGDRTTPAIVTFVNGDQVVGLAAKQGSYRNVANTIVGAKSMLGRSFDSVLAEHSTSTMCKLVEKDGHPVFQLENPNKQLTPKSVLEILYRKMLETADSQAAGGDSHSSVITVPKCFTAEQRLQVMQAASSAGFRVLRMITEPAACALAYDIGQDSSHSHSTVLVYRLGGQCLDLTLLDVNGGMYSVIDSLTKTGVAGNQMTHELCCYLAKEFYKKYKADPQESRRAMAKLMFAAEKCKLVLSTIPNAACTVDSLFEGIDFACNVTRPRFELLTNGIFQMCLQAIDDLLEEASMPKDAIQKVVVCGGAAKVPYLSNILAEKLPNAEILNSLAPDEVIALGAAKQAALLVDNEEEESGWMHGQSCLVDCCAKAILVLVENGDGWSETRCMIPRFCPIPTRRQHIFTLPESESLNDLRISILEEDENSGGTMTLGKLHLDSLAGKSDVIVTLHQRSDGSLHVSCSEKHKSKGVSLQLECT